MAPANRQSGVLVLPAILAIVFAMTNGSNAQQPAIDVLLARVGERVLHFYRQAQNVICIERSTVQPIDSSYSPQGFTRTVESELRIEADGGDASGEASVVRQVRKVNGRVPRETDKKDRDGCTDPNPLSTEPLAFLLPVHRSEYQFIPAGTGRDRDRDAILIDFTSVDRRSKPELIEDLGGHDDCFDWTGHVASAGRVWVDAQTFDLLRVERRLRGPVDVTVPTKIQRRHHLDNWVVVIRQDETIRYRTVAFHDPDEVLLVPESIDSVIIVRGGLQSTRRSQLFSDYKRFVTEGRVVK